MLFAVKTSSICFYAVAAAIVLLLAVGFFVAVVKKKRQRRAIDVIFIIFGAVVLAVSLVVGAFAVIHKYNIFELDAVRIDSKLAFYRGGKKLFAVPYIGAAAGLFADLDLSGVIVPFAVFLMCLVAVVTVGVKTYRVKAEKGEETLQASLQGQVTDAESTTDAGGYADIDGGESAGESDALPPAPEPEMIAPDEAKEIVDEIDRLVTGARDDGADDTDIESELKRAIREGYALFDSLQDDGYADTEEENFSAPQIDQSSEQPPAHEESDEQPIGVDAEDDPEQYTEESQDESLVFEDAPFTQTEEAAEESKGYEQTPEAIFADESEEENVDALEVEPEIVPNRVKKRASSENAVPIEETENVPDPPAKPAAVDYKSMYGQPRVRTIIRRPAAKDIADIEKRAEQISGETEVKTVTSSTGKKSTVMTPAKKKTKPSAVDSGASAKSAEPIDGKKTVVAESGGLPLTRKYIILNRHNAATVFNDYLNSKRESEKEELKGALNTIIMK